MNSQSGNNDFFLEQQRAVERMRETANRSRYSPPPASAPHTPAPKVQNEKPTHGNRDPIDNFLKAVDIPFLNRIRSDSDTALILGLVLLLSAEKSDRLLLIALIYILL